MASVINKVNFTAKQYSVIHYPYKMYKCQTIYLILGNILLTVSPLDSMQILVTVPRRDIFVDQYTRAMTQSILIPVIMSQ